MEQLVLAVDDPDVDDLRVEDLLDPVTDELVHRLHLEVLGKAALHVVDEGQLGVALPRLLEQPSVLERDAQASRERREEAHVRVAERVLSVEVLQRDHARRLAPHQERDEQRRLGRFPLEDSRLIEPFGELIEVLVGEERFTRLHHVAPEADDLDRLVGEPHAALDRVREADQTGRLVEDADVHDLRVEDLLEPVADQVVHRLHVQVHRESALDVVDERELGVALSGLVDQPRAFERRCDMAADELEQLLVRLGMAKVLAVALDDQSAERLPLGLEGNAEPVDGELADVRIESLRDIDSLLLLGDEHRDAGPQQMGGDPGRVADAEGVPEVGVGDVAVDLIHVVREVDRVAFRVIERDIEVVRVHQLADDRVDLPIEVLHVLGGARRLGDPVEGGLDLLRALAPRLVRLELGDAALKGADLVVEGGHAGASTSSAQSSIFALRPRISNSPSEMASSGTWCSASFVRSENSTV